jgi:cytochrome b561
VTPSNAGRYDGIAILLHWLIALALVANFALGVTMVEIPGITPAKLRYFNWHKWAGVTIFAVVTLRLLWRLFHRPPPLPDSTGRWQRRVAAATHWALYGLMFAVPLSGYFYSLAAGFPVVYLGVVKLPVLIGPDPALKQTLLDLHYLLNMALAGLVLAHVGAALKHHFIDRDTVLRRMLPRLPKSF